MKLRSGSAAVFGVWLIALVVVVAIHQRCKQGRIASVTQAPGVEFWGPDLEGMKRLNDKQQIVDEVLARRTSLCAAAAAFRRLDDGASSRWVRAPQVFPDAPSEEEAYCRSVLAYLHTAVALERTEAIADRLQAELNAILSSRKSQATAALQLLD